MSKGKSLTNLILLGLEKSVDGFVRLQDFTENTHIYVQGYERVLKKPLLTQAIRRLRKKGLIDFIDNKKLLLKLTDKGLNKAMLIKLSEVKNDKSTNKCLLVSFDIPEEKRIARDILRLRLKEWGFTQFQKSLWVSKKNYLEPVKQYIKFLGIKTWVKVFLADQIDI